MHKSYPLDQLHPLDLNVDQLNLYAEEVETVAHSTDDCLGTAGSLSTAVTGEPSTYACIFCFGCIVSCGS